MNDNLVTEPVLPIPPRPAYGFAAWQMTLGYICTHHSPDATLYLQARSAAHTEKVLWSAGVEWGSNAEHITDAESLAQAFRSLWQEVERHNMIFTRPEDAVRRPVGYDDHEWLELNTQDILHRLLWTTQMVFCRDWSLFIVYQPVEVAPMRVSARLMALDNEVIVGGRGPSLLEALRELYRSAASVYIQHTEAVSTENGEA